MESFEFPKHNHERFSLLVITQWSLSLLNQYACIMLIVLNQWTAMSCSGAGSNLWVNWTLALWVLHLHPLPACVSLTGCSKLSVSLGVSIKWYWITRVDLSEWWANNKQILHSRRSTVNPVDWPPSAGARKMNFPWGIYKATPFYW